MIATKVIKLTGTLALALACIGAQTSLADNTADKNSVQTVLNAAPAAELPAVAAQMVSKAKARERETTTQNVVQAALAINPAAAPAIVGAIARAVPEMAHTAAGFAAAQEPKQAHTIARAAAAAAPSKAGKIVIAVCSAVPNQYRSIALAVAEVAPTSSKDILKSVAVAVPALKPYIDKEIAGYGLSLPSVATTLDQARIAQA
ncbi:MAG TPA: hypothetical protein VN673_01205, partial [Clostridia bacterium]|nr:hypothetical protein [Clostridia bacterium]